MVSSLSTSLPISFLCTNRINLLHLKRNSGRLVIVAKGFSKLPNLHILIKQKSLSLPRNLAPLTFGELLIVFTSMENLLLSPLSNGPEVPPSTTDKAKLFTKSKKFFKNLNLDNSDISWSTFFSTTNLKLYILPVTETFPIYFFQGLTFLHLEITLPFAKLLYIWRKIIFYCHHNFMKKGHSNLSKNKPENIP